MFQRNIKIPFFGNRYKQIHQKKYDIPVHLFGQITQSSKCTTVLNDLETAKGILYLAGQSTYQIYRSSTLYHYNEFDLLAFEDIQLYIK